MGHGKETPRQKMIGMMYLVLTALLALQVQKEVLDAFINIDEGLANSRNNTIEKNIDVYNELSKQAQLNPVKAKLIFDLSQEIKNRSDAICMEVLDCKKEIVLKADGPDATAIKENEVLVEEIKMKNDMTIGNIVMVGSEKNGRGKKLEEMISSFREFLLKDVIKDKKSVITIRTIEQMLETTEKKTKQGVDETWMERNFEHIPIAGEVAILTGVENNVRNAEAEAIKYLLGSLSKSDFKFNTLVAAVVPSSNYVLKGNEYKAKIFLAAYDSTKNPVIYIGDKVDSVKGEDGSYYHTMSGYKDSVPVEQGVGIYTVRSSSVGNKKYKGIIKVQNPDGSWSTRTFEEEYQVAVGSYTVSPTKMNVFYLGVENPVKVLVGGVPADMVTAGNSNGNIRKKGEEWIVEPRRLGESIITVMAKIEGKNATIGVEKFRVKPIPDPVAKVSGRKGGAIPKNELMVAGGVQADLENFDFDLSFKVTKFKFVYIQSGGFAKEIEVNGNRFTPEVTQSMQNVNRNQRVYFEDIQAMGPDNIPRNLNSIVFKIL